MSDADKALIEAQQAALAEFAPGDFGGAGDADAEAAPYFQLTQAMSDAEKVEAHGVGTILLMPDEVAVASGDGASFEAVCVYSWKSWQQIRDADDTSGHFIMAESFDPASTIALRAGDWPDKKTGDTKHGGRFEKYDDDFECMFASCYHFALLVAGGEADGMGAVLTCMKSTAKTGRSHFNGMKRRAGRPKNPLPVFSHLTTVTIGTEPVPNKPKSTYFDVKLGVGAATEPAQWGDYMEAYNAAQDAYNVKKAQLDG